MTVLLIVSSASAAYIFAPNTGLWRDGTEEDDVEAFWHYTVPVEVHSGLTERDDRIVSLTLNITKELGGYGEFDENSVRVRETNDTWYPQWDAIFQERWLDDDNLEVSWLMNGTTPANTTRYYTVLFDTLRNGEKEAANNVGLLSDDNEEMNGVSVDVNEDGHLWISGDDYTVKIDVQRGGSRVVKYRDSTRKGYVYDTGWMSWYSDAFNWRTKGAEVNLTAEGPLYAEVEITSACGNYGYTWSFYPDSMRIRSDNDTHMLSFDTFADNVINTHGTLVWSDGSTEELRMTNEPTRSPPAGTPADRERGPPDSVNPGPPSNETDEEPSDDDGWLPPGRRYTVHRNIANYFYIIGPEDKERNASAGFWAVTENGLEQTIYRAGEKGLRWTMNGTEAWFGFAEYSRTANITLSYQYPPSVIRHRTIVKMVGSVIENEVELEGQILFVDGDMNIDAGGSLGMKDMEVYIDGSLHVWLDASTTIGYSILYIVEAGEGDRYLFSEGELDLMDTQVSTGEDHHLRIVLQNIANIHRSTFRHLMNGIEVYSDDVEIINVDIKHSKGAGIMVGEGFFPTLQGGEISDCEYGIWLGAEPVELIIDDISAISNELMAAPPTVEFRQAPEEVEPFHDVLFIAEYTGLDFSGKDPEDTWEWEFSGDVYEGYQYRPYPGTLYAHVVWLETGVFDISLTVTRASDGQSDTVSTTITITYPDIEADFTHSPTYPLISTTVTFTDTSEIPAELNIVEYDWTIDGEWYSDESEWQHQFNEPGEYEVTMAIVVEDEGGHTSEYEKNREIEVRARKPTADLSWEIDGLSVSFYDHSEPGDGWIVSRNWDFGDGHTSAVKNPTHTYDSRGVYTVKLTVENNYGISASTSKEIEVGNPTAIISEYKIVSSYVYRWINLWDMKVELDGSGSYPASVDGEIVNYRWEFVDYDGQVTVIEGENAAQVTHYYEHSEPVIGYHFPKLTVTDDTGLTHTTSVRIVSYDPDPFKTISGIRFHNNIVGILMRNESDMDAEKGDGVIRKGISEADNYVNIVDCSFYHNLWGIRSIGTHFAIKNTNIMTRDEYDISVYVNKALMVTVTGGYDRRSNRMQIMNMDELYPDMGDNVDHSGDGVGWIDEIWRYGTDPFLLTNIMVDTDGDGLTNQVEADVYGTDPLNPDTDGSGLTDLQEIEFGTNPLYHEPSDVSYRVTTVYPDRFETELVNIQQEEVDRWEIQAVQDPLYGPIDLSSVQPAGDILYPSIGNPRFVDRTDPSSRTFSIYVKATSNEYIGDVLKFELVDGTEIVNVNKVGDTWDHTNSAREVTVEVSSDIPEGLYNMNVEKGSVGNWIEASNSVQVVDGFNSPFKFVQITDLHIGKPFSVGLELSVSAPLLGYSDTISYHLYESEDRSYNAARFMALLDRINQIEDPDFVVITGDSVDYNHEKSMKAFRGALEHAEVPVFAIPGNHERGGLLGFEESIKIDYIIDIQAEMSFIPYPAKPTYFYEYINPEFDSGGECSSRLGDLYFDYGDFRSIVADSGPLNVEFVGITIYVHSIGRYISIPLFPNPWKTQDRARLVGFTEDQWDWIQDTAEGQDHVFFFTHGRIVGGGEEQRGRLMFYTEDFVEWANRDDVNVRAVFVGHSHQTGGYENRDLTNIDEVDYTWDSEGTRLFSEKPYYIETESSTDA